MAYAHRYLTCLAVSIFIPLHMIQRVQSLYLGIVCISIAAFLNVSVWVKVSLDRICTIKPYALILATDQYIIFPYGCCALYCCYLMGTAVYAMMRHNHRKLQLHLTTHITLLLMVLGGGIWMLVNKANAAYLPDGDSSYKIGIIFPFIALVANLLARHHIQKDIRLVDEDSLR
ncbi:DUF4293 family protein [Candidatus Cardinium hertigii]|uniref:DUF4293 family protein n=1 Tax=Candidatus Cardinium hertigii TaxID=247481 RepID=UPI003D7CF1CA